MLRPLEGGLRLLVGDGSGNDRAARSYSARSHVTKRAHGARLADIVDQYETPPADGWSCTAGRAALRVEPRNKGVTDIGAISRRLLACATAATALGVATVAHAATGTAGTQTRQLRRQP